MAVYTEVPDDALTDFIAQYDIGTVVSCKGIAEGIENSNYLLQTEKSSFILTLYEKRVAGADLPFFLALMEHLAGAGIACPVPIRGRDGDALRTLCGRPAAIVSFLMGMWPRHPTARHCAALGEAMARMHLAGASFAMTRPNDLSIGGWRRLLAVTGGRADELHDGLAAILTAEIAHLEANWPAGLETGIVHADLFPDNVFFLGDHLSGFIDFYFACNDFLAYDLAVCINAWCFDNDGGFSVTRARSLMAGYAGVRPLGDGERAALPVLARGSALRFMLTRLQDWFDHPGDALVRRKDPMEFLHRLRFHQAAAGPEAYGLP